MNRSALATVATMLFTAACTAGTWHGFGFGHQEDPGQALDRNVAQVAPSPDGAGYSIVSPDHSGARSSAGQGLYGWSYLNVPLVGSPLAAAHPKVDEDRK